MEEKARELVKKIDQICIGYNYFRNTDGLKTAKELAGDIQDYIYNLLMLTEKDASEDSILLQNYIVEVLEDYMEAIDQNDLVLMIDTLDYGLRELLGLSAGNTEESA